MSAVATWPGLLGGGLNSSRTNGLWTPARSSHLVNGYSSNDKRPGSGRPDSKKVGGMDRDSNRGDDKSGDRSVTRRENTAARAAAAVPAVPPADVDWTGLVERCLRGDGGAWAELVRSHHRRVYGMCYRFTGSAHDAEDLTQEVFLKLYGNLRSFNSDKGSFTTWITTLTRNLLVDHFRRSRMERSTDSLDAGWDAAEETRSGTRSGAELLQDARRSPHDHTVARELERMVQAALAKVSPELREAVILRDLEDMDYKEIALVLRVPEGTVKSRISRGRAELARLLGRNKKQVM
jgi:RNA polymerase sigma-70 factor, ECF subfamily